jgi:hypothetical protein
VERKLTEEAAAGLGHSRLRGREMTPGDTAAIDGPTDSEGDQTGDVRCLPIEETGIGPRCGLLVTRGGRLGEDGANRPEEEELETGVDCCEPTGDGSY